LNRYHFEITGEQALECLDIYETSDMYIWILGKSTVNQEGYLMGFIDYQKVSIRRSAPQTYAGALSGKWFLFPTAYTF